MKNSYNLLKLSFDSTNIPFFVASVQVWLRGLVGTIHSTHIEKCFKLQTTNSSIEIFKMAVQ